MINNFLLPNSKKLVFYKGQKLALLDHFKLKEFDCKCKYPDCTNTVIDYRILVALDRLRKVLGFPIHITSAYRCPKHNTDVGGKQNPISLHTKGQAVDIVCMTPKMPQFSEDILKQIFDVVIWYSDSNFFHCHFN